MATFTWTLQGATPTTIASGNMIKFSGTTFASKIIVGSFNLSTQVYNAGTDESAINSPKNTKYISNTGGTGGDGQCDIGAGTVDIDSVSTTDCPLKINFSHGSSVVTEEAIFYAYDGTTTTAAPVDVTAYAAEQGDANWTEMTGSGAPVTIADDASATSHDYYFLISASPDAVGLQLGCVFRIELVYA